MQKLGWPASRAVQTRHRGSGRARAVILSLLLALWSHPLRAQSYVGAERCAQCHAFAYKVWAASPHKKAHQSLTEAQLADTKCNNCHTHVGQADVKLEGVQCEHCHGPGKYYQPSYVMRDPELSRAVGLVETQPAHCQQCHTEGAPSIAPFDFKAMWALIDHSKAAQEADARAQQTAAETN